MIYRLAFKIVYKRLRDNPLFIGKFPSRYPTDFRFGILEVMSSIAIQTFDSELYKKFSLEFMDNMLESYENMLEDEEK